MSNRQESAYLNRLQTDHRIDEYHFIAGGSSAMVTVAPFNPLRIYLRLSSVGGVFIQMFAKMQSGLLVPVTSGVNGEMYESSVAIGYSSPSLEIVVSDQLAVEICGYGIIAI